MILTLLGLCTAGEIAGQLVDATGAPIEGALVLAYDVRLKYEIDYSDEDGAFRIDEIYASSRRVRIVTPDSVNAVEMYLGELPQPAYRLCDAEPLEVPAEGTVDVGVITVPAGGVVRGRLLDAEGLPVAGAKVDSRPAGVSPAALPRSGVSNVNGVFEVRGIPLAADGPMWSFDVEADDQPDQYLGPSWDSTSAAAFGVGLGEVKDLGDRSLLQGARLSGVVTGPSGPVADATVYAVTTGRTMSAPVVDGVFALPGLAPGAALIWAEAGGLATTWYPDEGAPRTTLPVQDGQIIDDLVLTMPNETLFTGQLSAIDDWTGTRVYLIDEGRAVTHSGTVAADGQFEVRSVASGVWSLEIDPAEGLDVVDGPLLLEDGNVRTFDLPVGGEVDVGLLDVPRGAVVEGRVVDRGTEEPVYGAWVYITNENTGTEEYTQSGRAGKFRAEGLPAGVYRMEAAYSPYCETDLDWVSRFYPDQRNSILQGSVPMAPGQVIEWDPRVPLDLDHDGMGDGWDARFGLDPDVDDSLEDLDEDGFGNLQEYLLSTNPASGGGAGCGAGGRSAAILWTLPILGLRRGSRKRKIPV